MFLNKIIIDRHGNIYQGTNGGGVLKSNDNGNSWTAVNNGLTGVTYVRDLVFSPEGILIAATNNGVYRYSEEYNYWTQLSNQGLRSLYINKLYYHNNTLYAGTDAGVVRFVGELPVELISFAAKQSDESIELNWTTATEKNNYGFEIHRKYFNEQFSTIGFVSGSGTKTTPTSYSFIDKNTEPGKCFYRLKQVDYNGSYEYSNEVEVNIAPAKFELHQNYPNPFNPITKILFSIPSNVKREMSNVILKVYDILGREVATLVNEEKPAGIYEVEFDGSNLSSGVYFYQLHAGALMETKKMMLLR